MLRCKHMWITLCLLNHACAYAASCDCTHSPISPVACLPVCRNAVLLKSNDGELTQKFKLDPEVARIFIEKRNSAADKADQAKKVVLPPEVYSSVVRSTEALSAKDTTELGSKYGLNKVESHRSINESLASTF
jgi:hypothetical protein